MANGHLEIVQSEMYYLVMPNNRTQILAASNMKAIEMLQSELLKKENLICQHAGLLQY